MEDQVEIHRMAQSDDVNERKEAVEKLNHRCEILEDKEQVWDDLHQLIQDKDDDVRWRAVDALAAAFSHIPEQHKEHVWEDFHWLTQDNYYGVRLRSIEALSTIYPHIPEKHKEQAWNDLRMLMRDKDESVRWSAAEAIGAVYSHIPEKHKEQAWNDLYKLLQDKDDDMRWRAVDALAAAFSHISEQHKEHVWENLRWLTQDNYYGVRLRSIEALSAIYSHIPEKHKEQTWNDLRMLMRDKDESVRWSAAEAIGVVYSHIPEKHKEQAWNDLYRLMQDKDEYVRWGATGAISAVCSYIPEKHKKQVRIDLNKLTNDEDGYMRWLAASALRSIYFYIPGKYKKKVWDDFIRLTNDKDESVRWLAASALFSAYIFNPRNKLKNYLFQLVDHKDEYLRQGAADALFSHVTGVSSLLSIPDHKQKIMDLLDILMEDEDDFERGRAGAYIRTIQSHYFPLSYERYKLLAHLHRLTQDKSSFVRRVAAEALDIICFLNPEKRKKQAYFDLHRLTQDKDDKVREDAAFALGSVYSNINEECRQKAWYDLHKLSQDKNDIRRCAAYAIGNAFSHIPETHKGHAWNDLTRLMQDEDKGISEAANYSLGRISIFRASESESEEVLRKEMENALGFFEKAHSRAYFCLPFYRFFYMLTFKKEEDEVEFQRYLTEVKNAVEESKNMLIQPVVYSDSKEKLFEVVENLANALGEVQKVRDTSFQSMKSDLNAYRQYCERAADLLVTTEEKAPRAIKLIKKGLPIIDERIKEIIKEIQEKSKTLCKQTKGTPLEELGKEVNRVGQTFSQIKDPKELEKGVDEILFVLSPFCSNSPEVCEQLKRAKEEPYLEDRIRSIVPLLGNVLSNTISKVDSKVDEIKADVKEVKANIKDLKSELKARFNKIEKNIDNIARGNEDTRNILKDYANKTQEMLLKLLDESKNCESKTQKLLKESFEVLIENLEKRDDKWLEKLKAELIKKEPEIEEKLSSSAPEIKSKWHKWIDYIKNKAEKETKEIIQKLPTEAVVIISAEKILEYGVPFLSAAISSPAALPALITILYAIRGIIPKDK